MIDIITIEREYECGRSDIAQLVAKRLGWKLWDHRLTIAKIAHCPSAVVEGRKERNDPLYYRLFKNPFSEAVMRAASTPLNSISSIARPSGEVGDAWLSAPPKEENVSLWAGVRESFSRTGQTHCVSSCMRSEKAKSAD
jgi:hypothetical protein